MESYQLSSAEKRAVFFHLMGLRLGRRKKLVLGPYAGEFGFEVGAWLPYAYAVAAHYPEIIACSYQQSEAFYRELKCDFCSHNVHLKDAGYGFGKQTLTEAVGVAKHLAEGRQWVDYDIFTPQMILLGHPIKLLYKRKWPLLGSGVGRDREWDVCFHFRDIIKKGSDIRENFGGEKAAELVTQCAEYGFKCAIVGHPAYAASFPPASDLRSSDLNQTIEVLRKSRVFIGQLSGPTHLANMAGVDAIMWADGQWRIDAAKKWNPHNCRQIAVCNDSFAPSVDAILGAIINYLD